MRMLITRLLCTLLFIIFSASVAFAQENIHTFHLKDGSTIQGKVVAQDDSMLIIETKYGILEIRKEKIVRQEKIKQLAPSSEEGEIQIIRLKDGTVVKGIIISESEDSLGVEISYGTIAIPKSKVKQIGIKTFPEEEWGYQTERIYSPIQPKIERNWEIFGGINFPTGDFSEVETEEAGFANTGFSAGIQYRQKVGESQNTEFCLLGVLSYNKMNEKEYEKQFEKLLPDVGVQVGHWLLIWFMGGFGLNAPLSPSCGFFMRGLIGGLLGVSPNINVSYEDYYNDIEVKTDPATALALGYGFESGFIFDNFGIEFRFLTAKPKYTVSITGENYSTGISDTESTEIKQSTSIILLTIAIKF